MIPKLVYRKLSKERKIVAKSYDGKHCLVGSFGEDQSSLCGFTTDGCIGFGDTVGILWDLRTLPRVNARYHLIAVHSCPVAGLPEVPCRKFFDLPKNIEFVRFSPKGWSVAVGSFEEAALIKLEPVVEDLSFKQMLGFIKQKSFDNSSWCDRLKERYREFWLSVL